MIDDIYKRIVDTWGVESQLNMVTEEMGELLQAISKFRRAQDKDEVTKTKAFDHLCEEVADVENMLNQMRYILDTELIDKHKKYKLERITKRLDEYDKSQKEKERENVVVEEPIKQDIDIIESKYKEHCKKCLWFNYIGSTINPCLDCDGELFYLEKE